MLAGKSRELIRRGDTLASIGKRCLYVSPLTDTRSPTAIVCHAQETRQSLKVATLASVEDSVLEAVDVVLVDELQFFESSDAIAFIDRVDRMGKHGVCSSLVGDSNCTTWETFAASAARMDDITFLRAYCQVCNDGTKAAFTYRTSASTERVLIGGAADYMPRCKKHMRSE